MTKGYAEGGKIPADADEKPNPNIIEWTGTSRDSDTGQHYGIRTGGETSDPISSAEAMRILRRQRETRQKENTDD